MERALRIEAFRNIGFKDDKPWHERLVLNNSLKKGELGDLLILIGANNSGKSNVLEALQIFGNGKITERDVTDLPFDDDCRKPKLVLFSRNDDAKEDEFAYTKQFNDKNLVKTPKNSDIWYKFLYSTKETILADLDTISDVESNYIKDEELCSLWNAWTDDGENSEKELSNEEFKKLSQQIFDILKNYKAAQLSAQEDFNQNRYTSYKAVADSWNNFFTEISETNIFKEFENHKDFEKPNWLDLLDSTYAEKYGYNFLPKIYVYEEAEISNKNLKTDYDSVKESDFFNAVFNSIGVDVSEVLKAHENYSAKENMAILETKAEQLNKKLKTVSAKFNKLYYLENAPYTFGITLTETTIRFWLKRGDAPILLDYQSAGFKWFFNIFFNLLNANDLNSGDIIIMDEPATHLHRDGRKELRALFKEFAIKNDILIVIATHEDALIDLDNLDELRIVISKDNVSSIVNNFAAVDPTVPDTLLPIRKVLTVENHILVNPDEKIIFVEGITDYNYLTAFKKLFGEQGITFLPINGVGEKKEDCEAISKELIRIRKHNPILLVDNDKAGQQMKKLNEKDSALTVIALNDIDENFKTIESLFAQEDLQTFGLLDENGTFVKHASTSTVFKNQILKNKDAISETTRANFRKVFDKLLHEAE